MFAACLPHLWCYCCVKYLFNVLQLYCSPGQCYLCVKYIDNILRRKVSFTSAVEVSSECASEQTNERTSERFSSTINSVCADMLSLITLSHKSIDNSVFAVVLAWNKDKFLFKYTQHNNRANKLYFFSTAPAFVVVVVVPSFAFASRSERYSYCSFELCTTHISNSWTIFQTLFVFHIQEGDIHINVYMWVHVQL